MAQVVKEGKGSNYDRMMSAQTQEFAKALIDWHAAMEQATGEKLEAALLLQVVLRPNAVYPNGKFDAQKSKKYASRVRTLPNGFVDECIAAIRTTAGTAPSKPEAIAYIIQHEEAFSGDAFLRDKKEGIIRRLSSLSPMAISKWAKAADVSEDLCPFALIRVSALFKNNTFQLTAFEQALPVAEKLIALQTGK
jgi:hypothetical protein